MKKLILIAAILTSCSSESKKPEANSHWHEVDSFDYFPSVHLWRNDNTGTCIAIYGDASIFIMPEKDCQ